jgi:acyl carrier protein
LNFDEFAEFLRAWGAVSKKRPTTPETQFDRDLGITGDDGSDLLVATEKRFGISLSSEEEGYRKTFNLAANEYLFHPEGFGTVYAVISIFNTPTVRAFTVGELFAAVVRALETKGN